MTVQTASNPRDTGNNPLDLSDAIDSGVSLAFEFSTATRPKIDFHQSTIGGMVINDLQGANGGLSPHDLPSTELTEVSTVIDLALKFTKPMDEGSIMESTLSLNDVTGNTAPFNFKLDDGSADPYLDVSLDDDGGVEKSLLRIRTREHDGEHPKFILLSDTMYRLVFNTQASNPRDTGNNPWICLLR